MVITIIALGTGLTVLALRDGQQQRLEQEGVRLAALLEAGRMESRTTGRPMVWRPSTPGAAAGEDFRFESPGGPRRSGEPLPQAWLHEGTRAEVMGAPRVLLGPEPILPAQRVRIQRGSQTLVVGTDGLSPFRVQTEASP